MMMTRHSDPVEPMLAGNYFGSLIDMVFKILPLWENREATLPVYIESLQAELSGFKGLVIAVSYDSMYLSLLSILQYLLDHPELEVPVVKREVFHMISLCNKLKSRYAGNEVEVRS